MSNIPDEESQAGSNAAPSSQLDPFEESPDDSTSTVAADTTSSSGVFAKPVARQLFPSASSSKKRRSDHGQDPLVGMLMMQHQEDQDENALFGRSIAAFLRSLPEERRGGARIRFEMVKEEIKYGRAVVIEQVSYHTHHHLSDIRFAGPASGCLRWWRRTALLVHRWHLGPDLRHRHSASWPR